MQNNLPKVAQLVDETISPPNSSDSLKPKFLNCFVKGKQGTPLPDRVQCQDLGLLASCTISHGPISLPNLWMRKWRVRGEITCTNSRSQKAGGKPVEHSVPGPLPFLLCSTVPSKGSRERKGDSLQLPPLWSTMFLGSSWFPKKASCHGQEPQEYPGRQPPHSLSLPPSSPLPPLLHDVSPLEW